MMRWLGIGYRLLGASAFLNAALWAAGGAAAYASEPPGFIREEISVSLPDGRRLTGELRVPAGDTARPLPAFLVFGGFQNAARVLDLVNPEQPVVLASFDYPFSPPRKFVFPQSLKFAPDAKRMIHDTVGGIQALASQLRDHPRVRPDQITIIGASLGAPFAVLAASKHPDISGVAVVHGFGAIPGTIAHQLERKWRPKWGWAARPAARVLGLGAWWYLGIASPEEAAKTLGANQRVLMISAEQDSFIPKEASEALWSALERSPAKSERIVMPGDHLLPGSDELIGELMKISSEWATRVGLMGE